MLRKCWGSVRNSEYGEKVSGEKLEEVVKFKYLEMVFSTEGGYSVWYRT